jgi:hypothetical protein
MAAAPATAAPAAVAVQVVVRARPLLERERAAGGDCGCVTVTGQQSLVIHDGDRDVGPRSHRFTFDRVFSEHASQQQVYEEVARPVVQHVLDGINATVFAYGQTGSGKTYTMDGQPGRPGGEGMISRAIHEVFAHISERQGHRTKFLVRASYAQIHNEVVSDLIKPERTHLSIREDEKGVYVEGLSEWIVRSEDEILSLMAAGARARSTGATLMNDQSSRSHAVFTLVVEQSQTLQQTDGEQRCERGPVDEQEQGRHRVLAAKLNLVDLAGSERVRESGATGSRLKETQHINLSLSALGNVIAALTSGDGVRSHVPYRDAKLTRLLADSLGGNCKTTVIANLSPAPGSFNESLSTLKFTQRAKRIKNRARVNEDVDKRTLLRRYEKELRRLRGALENQRQQVVGSQVEVLRNERVRAQRNHQAAQRQLETQYAALAAERQQKLVLAQQIKELEQQLIGGSGSESRSDAALMQEEQAELLSRQSRFETERQRQELAMNTGGGRSDSQASAATAGPARSGLDDCVRLLAQQRDIMEALTHKLEERESTMTWLQDKLDRYDEKQRDLLANLGVNLDVKAGSTFSAEEFLASYSQEQGGEESFASASTPIAAGASDAMNASTTARGGPTEIAAAIHMLDKQAGDEDDDYTHASSRRTALGADDVGHDAAGWVAPSPSITAGTSPMCTSEHRRNAWAAATRPETHATSTRPRYGTSNSRPVQSEAANVAHRVSQLQSQHEDYKAQAEAALAGQQEEFRTLSAEIEAMRTSAVAAASPFSTSTISTNGTTTSAAPDQRAAEESASAAKEKVQRLAEQVAVASKERVTLKAILQQKVLVLADSLNRIYAEVGGCTASVQAWAHVEDRVGRELHKLQYLVGAAVDALRTPSNGGHGTGGAVTATLQPKHAEVDVVAGTTRHVAAEEQRRQRRQAQESRVQAMLAAAHNRNGPPAPLTPTV